MAHSQCIRQWELDGRLAFELYLGWVDDIERQVSILIARGEAQRIALHHLTVQQLVGAEGGDEMFGTQIDVQDVRDKNFASNIGMNLDLVIEEKLQHAADLDVRCV